MNKKIVCLLAFVAISTAASARPHVRYNPRGPVGGPGYGNHRGGRGTNWENPRGPVGGPGYSSHWGDNDNNPPGRIGGRGSNWENRPG